MKSIKEKAEEYGLQYPVIHYDADGNTYDDVDKPSADFDAGANYVLEAVKDILFRRYSDDGDPKQRWIDMKELIKALER